jgi:hypothetical protein
MRGTYSILMLVGAGAETGHGRGFRRWPLQGAASRRGDIRTGRADGGWHGQTSLNAPRSAGLAVEESLAPTAKRRVTLRFGLLGRATPVRSRSRPILLSVFPGGSPYRSAAARARLYEVPTPGTGATNWVASAEVASDPSVPSVSSVVAPRAPDTAEVARRFQGCQDPAMTASAVLPGT